MEPQPELTASQMRRLEAEGLFCMEHDCYTFGEENEEFPRCPEGWEFVVPSRWRC